MKYRIRIIILLLLNKVTLSSYLVMSLHLYILFRIFVYTSTPPYSLYLRIFRASLFKFWVCYLFERTILLANNVIVLDYWESSGILFCTQKVRLWVIVLDYWESSGLLCCTQKVHDLWDWWFARSIAKSWSYSKLNLSDVTLFVTDY